MGDGIPSPGAGGAAAWQSSRVRYKSNADLVAALVRRGAIRSDAVRTAMEATDRASFLPAGARDEAYADAPVILKTGEAGLPSSTASQPTMVALMLEELEVRPGHRVLEVGTASGYNAALLAHLVGDEGLVVTIELDPELASIARQRLAPLSNVRVVTGDGAHGHPADAPYDGIVVTAGAPHVHPTWIDQLRSPGHLVVPLTGADRRGRCVTYERFEGELVEVSSTPCGFVPLR